MVNKKISNLLFNSSDSQNVGESNLFPEDWELDSFSEEEANPAEKTFLPDDWEQASEREQSIEKNTEKVKDLKEEYKKQIDINDKFYAFTDFHLFPDDYLIINDVYLTDVPTSGISLGSKTDVFVAETLRTSAPVVSSKGRQDIVLTLSLVFKPGKSQTEKLKRIVATISKNPYVFIYNNYINKALSISNNQSTIFALEHASLRNSSESIGIIILEASFHLFNYKPFSNHFYYNGKLGGVTQKINNPDDIETPIDISEFGEYEPSEQTISKYTEKTRKTIKRNLELYASLKKKNVPVTFPSESDAWMYYADKLSSSEFIPEIIDNCSDYVGISIRDYQYFSPPLEARIGEDFKNFSLEEDFRPIVYPYKNNESKPTFQDKTISILTKPADKNLETKFINTKTGGTTTVKLLTTYGEPSADASFEISKIWRVGKYKDTPPVQLELIRRLALLSNQFPGKTIRIISLTRKSKNGKKNKHVTGHAIDFKISGINNEDLVRYLRTIKASGVGYYPNSSFVHLDAREKSAFWVDISGNGEKSKYVSRNEVGSWIKKIESSAEVDSDIEEMKEAKDYKSPLSSQKDIQAKIDRKKQSKDITVQTREKSKKARQVWIKSMKEQGWSLYQDNTIKNVFFKKYGCNISGDFFLQKNNVVLNNIVLSAISVSFGHRIAPLKLLGQDIYTYQFLGAGNKMGQLVFTFSGEQGKTSANYIKELISKSRSSANQLGSLVKEAGTVELSSLFLETGEQNTILALLNINNIIVTNIEESSSPDGSGKFQLLVEFIVQDFQAETLQRQFEEPFSSKKQIVKRILSLVKKRGSKSSFTDFISIFPDPLVAKVNMKEGREYEVPNGVPSWVSKIAIEAARICQEINNKIPPVTWKINEKTSRTWKENYEDWGGSHIFSGRVENIFYTEQNAWTSFRNFAGINDFGQEKSSYIDYTGKRVEVDNSKTLTYEDMFSGKFEYDGGERTNETHKDLFRQLINRMNGLVSEVFKYVSDEENFEKYFGDIGKKRINSFLEAKGECYSDLSLPNVPNTSIPLPPDFYIYNDSLEDPLFSSLTDRKNLKELLRRQTNLEFSSIQNFMRDSLLGGSYLSKNLPRILENRSIEENKYLKNEFNFIDGFSNMFKEGTHTWDPLYYREDESFSSASVKSWQTKISSLLDGESEEQKRFNFMDDIVKLSPYLKSGRKWNSPYTQQDKETQIESLYGDAYSMLSFGPNPEYITVDSILDGNPVPKGTLAFREKLKEKVSSNYAKSTNKEVELGGDRTVTAEGVVTVGAIKEEAGAEKESFFSSLFSSVKDNKEELYKIAAYSVAMPMLPFGSLPLLTTAYETYSGFINNLTSQLKDAKQLANVKKEELKHPIGDKIDRENQAEQIAELSSGISLHSKMNDLSFRRALPTFKINFIEDDSQEDEKVDKKTVRAFDDFYSYSAIQEIRITRSRKIASDLAVIRMTNIGGKLFRKRYEDSDADYRNLERQGIFANTELENPFEKLILQDGIKVQVLLGYNSSSDLLESVFLGQIVETSLSEDGRLVEIMCQGYGAELEAVELGPLEDGSVFYSSQQVLSGSIIQESIVNFGRRSKSNLFNPAEVRHAWTGGDSDSLFSNINPSSIISDWSNKKLDKLFSQNIHLNYPQDDNIFVPPPNIYSTSWERFWNNMWLYRPIKQTAWQIFKEHELRHPGYISLAVPYGHSSRMTMFFGSKNQFYWSRPPSSLELYLTKNASNSVLNLKNLKEDPNNAAALSQKLSQIASQSPDIANAIISDIMGTDLPTNINKYIGEQFGRYKPFRNYHYLDSEHHILKNEIRTSVDGVYNEVEILYFEDENEIQDSDKDDLNQSLNSLHQEEAGFYSVKLDENIPENLLRCYREEFPSCVTETMAKRYAQGIFARHLRDAYKGEITILGKETIKPFDICFLSDKVNQMYGPVEVEAVTHVFNSDVGFVSIITPDLCVEANELFSAATLDVVGSSLGMIWGLGSSVGLLAGAIVGLGGFAAAAGLSFLSAYGGVKFVSWTQEGEPVIITPLTLNGRPFISNSLGTKKTSMFLNYLGKWNQYWDDLGDAWDKVDLSEAFTDTKTSFAEKFYNLLGPGAQGGIE